MSGYGSWLGTATSGVWEFFLDPSLEWFKGALRSEPVKSKVTSILEPFIRGKIRRVLAKPLLILDEMCRLYGKFASYLRRVLCKTRLIFFLV